MRGGLFGFGGGRVGGLGLSAGGGGFAGEALRRVGGFSPQLDSRISSSAQPSHPNSPRVA